MRAMPYTSEHIGKEGANISNFFVHTPICCPSRTTLLGGRFYHNNKVSLEGEYDPEAPYHGCMSTQGTTNVPRSTPKGWLE